MLVGTGTPYDGDVAAIAFDRGAATGSEQAWPLDRAPSEIEDLVRTGDDSDLTSPVRIDDPDEVAALRALRVDAVSFAFQVSHDGIAYSLYLRDELPPDVNAAIEELMGLQRR
jgi:hypothetical protein